MKGADLHPKTIVSNTHLEQVYKGLWSDEEKRLHLNVLELKAFSLAL